MTTPTTPTTPTSAVVDTTAVKQQLADSVLYGQRIAAWCQSIMNASVQATTATWYTTFVANLKIAQQHATTYTSYIGPDAWTVIPTALQTYGQQHALTLQALADIIAKYAPPTPKGEKPVTVSITPWSMDDITMAVSYLQALSQQLTALVGDATSTTLSNLPDASGNTPAQETVTGLRNDLRTFHNNIVSDNQNLTQGKDGAAKQVSLLTADEQKMNDAITSLNQQIEQWDNDITISGSGLGLSLIMMVAGFALGAATGGVGAIVVGCFAVLGAAGSATSLGIFNTKVGDAQSQIIADNSELTSDQQQVAALNVIINAFNVLQTHNLAAQQAVESSLDFFTDLAAKITTLVNDMQKGIEQGKSAISNKSVLGSGLLDMDSNLTIEAWNDLAQYAGNLTSNPLPQVTINVPSAGTTGTPS